ncbi:MAG TPA: sodium:proton antiporter [Planctomycetota bacterium]|nr:sodium:proton antiporter [Planctomycetota bacterium]
MRKFSFAALLGAIVCCASASAEEAGGPLTVTIPGWWSLPFLLLLSCIAFVPFIHKPIWEKFFAHISIGLGLLVAAVYLTQLGAHGREKLGETALEYFKFIALVGSLFVISGGILIDISGGGNPRVNTLLLIAGLALANIVGTTGASALLIRPFLKINKDRMKPFHVVLFIFIVSNCAGALTPVGDPPLFLGYINGVPFEWTILHCWQPWLLCNGLLLAVFFALDLRAPKTHHHNVNRLEISGWRSVFCLGLVLCGVFIDRILAVNASPRFEAWPIGAMVMLIAAFISYRATDTRIHQHNDFHFGPIKEVALLFVGIFATMMPALEYLEHNASHLGILTPGGFYFGSGSLSSFLDNAPAYLNFLTAAHGVKGMEFNSANVLLFSQKYPDYLRAVSLGAVFFGACTYIGNGPNFMVKAIADSAGAKTPSFFAYIFKYTIPILVPILVLVWYLFLKS